jgi:hypothetical protein
LFGSKNKHLPRPQKVTFEFLSNRWNKRETAAPRIANAVLEVAIVLELMRNPVNAPVELNATAQNLLASVDPDAIVLPKRDSLPNALASNHLPNGNFIQEILKRINKIFKLILIRNLEFINK